MNPLSDIVPRYLFHVGVCFVIKRVKIIFVVFGGMLILGLDFTGSSAPMQSSSAKETYVAKAGDIYISTDEFVKRFEMLPGLFRHRAGKSEEDKLVFLYSLIAEKLLAQEAIARSLDTDSAFRTSFDEIRTMLARDELYRQEISKKVTVSKSEINEGIVRARKELLVSYLFFDREENARHIRKQLSTPADFVTKISDSTMSFLHDTITVNWSNAQPEIEDAVFALKEGEISPVIWAGSGFYILTVVAVHADKYYSTMQPNVIKERVREKIRSRKEKVRALEFVQNFLTRQTGYTRLKPFNALCTVLRDIALQQSQDSLVTFTPAMWNEVRKRTTQLPNDSMVIAGSTLLRVSDVVEMIAAKDFTVDRGRLQSIQFTLNSVLRDWVHQELLGEEAMRRGLDQSPTVLRQLDVWRQNFLAEIMKAYIRVHVSLTSGEFQSALLEAEHIALPRVNVRELRTHTIKSMHEALRDLTSGMAFEAVIQRWSDDDSLKAKRGLSGFFPITERLPLGEIAWGMSIGERYGPINIENVFVFFELVAKDSIQRTLDFTRKESLEHEALQMKRHKVLNQFLAQLGKRHGFDIYQEGLTRANVSGTAMMTFRLLGFGGKMFAVPFVDKQFEWVNVEPPEGTIIP